MKKLLTTIALAFALLLGGTVALAGPASAEECPFGICQPPAPACEPFNCPTPEPPACKPFEPCVPFLQQRVAELEQTANDYRSEVVALTAKVEHVQRIADRRAATIQRLRAVIRSLR